MIYLLKAMRNDYINFDIIFATYDEEQRDREYAKRNPDNTGYIIKEEIEYDKAVERMTRRLDPLDHLVKDNPIETTYYCWDCGKQDIYCDCDNKCCPAGIVCSKCRDYGRESC